MIGLYIMHKHGFTAKQAIAWLRLCRPGSVVGDQQQFMESMEKDLGNIVRNQKPKVNRKLDQARTTRELEPSPARHNNFMKTPERKMDAYASDSSSEKGAK